MITVLCRSKLFLCSIVLLAQFHLHGQRVTQSLRGEVTDEVTGTPVAGLTLKLTDDASTFEATSDDNGKFLFNVPVGRYKLEGLSSLYRINPQEVVVISGHESRITLAASQVAQDLQSVEVTSSGNTSLPGNVRSLSIEKTLRFPANFFDPVRVATAYPGVIAVNDQNNSILVRGNSSNGLLWRLNGLDIVNPNHLANAGTLSDRPVLNGGGVNILSAQMLDRTDFYIGALPANFGNVISGVVDMKMREGSSTEMQYTAQASLIGIDFAAEGPVTKSTSFVANYRYSTVGLLSAMGVNLGDEAISFQDLSMNWSTNLKAGAKLSFFGIWGASENEFESKPSGDWEEDKDQYDINYSSDTYASGLNFSKPFGNGELFVGAVFSSAMQQRDASPSDEIAQDERYFYWNRFSARQSLLSTNVKYKIRLTARSTWELGIMTNYLDNRFDVDKYSGCDSCEPLFTDVSGSNEGVLLQQFAIFSTTISSLVKLDLGARYLEYGHNNSSRSLEPRLNVRLTPSAITQVDISYSLIGQLQQASAYRTNRELGLTRSHNIDVTARTKTKGDLSLTGGLFYQSLFDVPVSDFEPAFSAINALEEIPPPGLENNGTGRNYGADLMVEKMFYSSNFFLIGGSYYDSKYKGADGIERDTRWNGNYTVNSTYGKEWSRKEKNRVIALSTRILYLGGLRESKIDLPRTRFVGETSYDKYNNPYSEKLKDYFRFDLRLSFRKNRPKYTRTFAIDIQNLTNQQNEAYHYYDFIQEKIVTKFQLGIIPVLVYRIDF
jgi:hypothetical protein